MRSLGKNKDEIGSLGAETDSLDQFYGYSPEDHQHQYAEVAVDLELLGSVFLHPDFASVGAKIYKTGNLVSLYGVIGSSAPETDLIRIPEDFIPGSEFLPIVFSSGGSVAPAGSNLLTLDSTGLISIQSAVTITWIDLSPIRYVFK